MSNAITRYDKFRIEMIKNQKKWKDIAGILGISINACLMAIQRETIKEEHYAKLIEMGFSEAVLPKPITK